MLRQLPQSLSALSKLRILDLGSNDIEELVSRIIFIQVQLHLGIILMLALTSAVTDFLSYVHVVLRAVSNMHAHVVMVQYKYHVSHRSAMCMGDTLPSR